VTARLDTLEKIALDAAPSLGEFLIRVCLMFCDEKNIIWRFYLFSESYPSRPPGRKLSRLKSPSRLATGQIGRNERHRIYVPDR